MQEAIDTSSCTCFTLRVCGLHRSSVMAQLRGKIPSSLAVPQVPGKTSLSLAVAQLSGQSFMQPSYLTAHGRSFLRNGLFVIALRFSGSTASRSLLNSARCTAGINHK